MLAPNQRQLYLDALKPPPGYFLDRAVGTTFSLDLLTMLTLPLGFALLDWGNNTKELLHDPVKLLESLRRYADRITVFCQAGRISLPTKRHPLFAHLEKSVVEVFPPHPRKGVFHPKVWLLRFTAENEPVQYRFLCLSRNLTADRSLDTILALDGELTNRQRAYSRNHPLANFFTSLSGWAKRKVDPERKAWISQMAEEAKLIDFRSPEPFEDFEFIPLGLTTKSRDVLADVKGRGRTLFLSPFLSRDYLKEFERTDSDILISRADSLDQIPAETLKRFGEVWTLQEGVEDETLAAASFSDPAGEDAATDEIASDDSFSSFSGLHAKLFINENGWDADVLTGSANMTSAAFYQNIEFLVRLRGKKSQVGIDKFMGGDKSGGFKSLLSPYWSPETPPNVNKELSANLELVAGIRAELSRLPLRFKVARAGDDKLFSLELGLRSKVDLDFAGALVSVRPVTLKEDRGLPWKDLARQGHALFSNISVAELTSFLAVSIEVGKGKALARERFVLNLPLENPPEDRMHLLLKETLSAPGAFVRYLLLLLAREEDPMGGAAALLFHDKKGAAGNGGGNESLPLFEELIRAYSRSPARLEAIGRLVNDLKATPGGRDVLPEGFENMWAPIWAACQGGGK